MAKKNRKIASRGYRAFRVCNVIIMILLMVVILVPILSVVVNSFVSAAEIARRGVFILWPEEIDIGSYQYLWECRGNILRAYGNTLFRTVVGTALSLIVTAMMAYSLSKKYLKGRVVINGMVFFTMLFGGGLIPTYLLVRDLHMINTFWVMILPGAMSVYNMIITRTFFQNGVPHELLEASQIDGCSDARYFFSILLPLSQAVISVISLYYAVAHWNSYFSALIYIRDKQLQPLQLILRSILLSTRVSLNEFEDPDLLEGKIGLEFLVKFALIVVSSAPIMCLYPFVQKFFAKGVMLGSVKG